MYTYKCEKCGKEFEVEERLIEKEGEDYPYHYSTNNEETIICGRLYRVYQPTTVVIKGIR